MAKRLIVTLLAVASILGTLGYVKFRQVEVAVAQGAAFQIPPTAVTTVVAKRETWPSTLTVIGTAAAVEGVTVSADLPGTIDKIHFESGQWVHLKLHDIHHSEQHPFSFSSPSSVKPNPVRQLWRTFKCKGKHTKLEKN